MKTVFITGGATGIGAATVKKFIAEGVKVGCFDKNTADSEKLVIESGDDNILFIEGDVRDAYQQELAIQQTINRFGSLDMVFANAGIYQSNSILDITDEELNYIIDVNLKGIYTIPALKWVVQLWSWHRINQL